ncbi:membrane protein [Microbacterium phage ChickenKing]|nr:membrane protein [Microbacterium phage ChickenKing]
MATNIDPRPVTSFDDLLTFTEAELEEFRAPEAHPVWNKVLGVLLWIPVLLAVLALTVVVCFLIWWSIYGDEAFKASMYALLFFLDIVMYGKGL